jgi:hypothetical protein
MAMNVEAEIRELERRVGELGSFGFLTQQLRAVHKNLLAFQERTEQRFEKIDGRFEKVDGRFNRLEKEVRDLCKDMPGIVASTMREVLRERPQKSRKPT